MSDPHIRSVQTLALRIVSTSPLMDRRLPIRVRNRVEEADCLRISVEQHGSAHLGIRSTSRWEAYELDTFPTILSGGCKRPERRAMIVETDKSALEAPSPRIAVLASDTQTQHEGRFNGLDKSNPVSI